MQPNTTKKLIPKQSSTNGNEKSLHRHHKSDTDPFIGFFDDDGSTKSPSSGRSDRGRNPKREDQFDEGSKRKLDERNRYSNEKRQFGGERIRKYDDRQPYQSNYHNDRPRNPDNRSKYQDDRGRNSDDRIRNTDNRSKYQDERPRNSDDRSRNPDSRSRHQDDRQRDSDDWDRSPEDKSRNPDTRSRYQDDRQRDSDDRSRNPDNRSRHQDDRGRYSDDRGRYSDDRGRYSDDRGRYSDDSGRSSDDKVRSSGDKGSFQDKKARSQDDRRRTTDDRGRNTDNRLKHYDKRLKPSDDRSRNTDNRSKYQDDRQRHQDDRSKYQDDRVRNSDDWTRSPEDKSKYQDERPRNSDTRSRHQDDRQRDSDNRPRNSDNRSRNQDDRSRDSDNRSKYQDDRQRDSNDWDRSPEDKPRNSDNRSRNQDDRSRNQDDRSRNQDDRQRDSDDWDRNPEDKVRSPDDRQRRSNERKRYNENRHRNSDDNVRKLDHRHSHFDERTLKSSNDMNFDRTRLRANTTKDEAPRLQAADDDNERNSRLRGSKPEQLGDPLRDRRNLQRRFSEKEPSKLIEHPPSPNERRQITFSDNQVNPRPIPPNPNFQRFMSEQEFRRRKIPKVESSDFEDNIPLITTPLDDGQLPDFDSGSSSSPIEQQEEKNWKLLTNPKPLKVINGSTDFHPLLPCSPVPDTSSPKEKVVLTTFSVIKEKKSVLSRSGTYIMLRNDAPFLYATESKDKISKLFIFSTELPAVINGEGYFGFLRVNSKGTAFTLVSSMEKANDDREGELLSVTYVKETGSNMKQMRVVLEKNYRPNYPLTLGSSILEISKTINTKEHERFIYYETEVPFVALDGSLSVQFGSSHVLPSRKNYQIRDRETADVLFQVFKTSFSSFSVKFGNPFVPLYAFSVAIAALIGSE